MERQFLKDFGLEAETIDKIIDEHHANVNNVKEQLSTKKEEIKSLKAERDEFKQKAQEAEDEADEVNSLRSKYEEAKKEIDNYKANEKKNQLEKQVIKNVPDAYDIDDVLNHLDTSKFEYDDDGNVSNFDDVIKEVRKSKPHYFSTKIEDDPAGNDNPEGDNNDQDNQTNTSGVSYATGKGKGSGKVGSNDYEAIGNKWAEILGGAK